MGGNGPKGRHASMASAAASSPYDPGNSGTHGNVRPLGAKLVGRKAETPVRSVFIAALPASADYEQTLPTRQQSRLGPRQQAPWLPRVAAGQPNIGAGPSTVSCPLSTPDCCQGEARARA